MALLEFSELLSENTREKLMKNSSTGCMPLFAVFDGHGGDQASERSSKDRESCVAGACMCVDSNIISSVPAVRSILCLLSCRGIIAIALSVLSFRCIRSSLSHLSFSVLSRHDY